MLEDVGPLIDRMLRPAQSKATGEMITLIKYAVHGYVLGWNVDAKRADPSDDVRPSRQRGQRDSAVAGGPRPAHEEAKKEQIKLGGGRDVVLVTQARNQGKRKPKEKATDH